MLAIGTTYCVASNTTNKLRFENCKENTFLSFQHLRVNPLKVSQQPWEVQFSNSQAYSGYSVFSMDTLWDCDLQLVSRLVYMMIPNQMIIYIVLVKSTWEKVCGQVHYIISHHSTHLGRVNFLLNYILKTLKPKKTFWSSMCVAFQNICRMYLCYSL